MSSPLDVYMFLGEPPPEKQRPAPVIPKPPFELAPPRVQEPAQPQVQLEAQAPELNLDAPKFELGTPDKAEAPEAGQLDPNAPKFELGSPTEASRPQRTEHLDLARNPTAQELRQQGRPANMPRSFSANLPLATGVEGDLYSFLGEEPPQSFQLAPTGLGSEAAPGVQGPTRLQRVQAYWRERRARRLQERAEREAALSLNMTGVQRSVIRGGLSEHMLSRSTEPNLSASDDFHAMLHDDDPWQQHGAKAAAGVTAAKQWRMYGAGAMWYQTAKGRHLREQNAAVAAAMAPGEGDDDPTCAYQAMKEDNDELPAPSWRSRQQQFGEGYHIVGNDSAPPAPVFGSAPRGPKAESAPSSPTGLRERVKQSKQDWYQAMQD